MERDRTPRAVPGLEDMRGLRGATLTARFLCELAMLAALAFWGYVVGDGVWAWLLGILAPVVAAVIWGTFVAPRAKVPVPAPVRVAIGLALYGAAGGGRATRTPAGARRGTRPRAPGARAGGPSAQDRPGASSTS